MREIKFRVWHKNIGTMINWDILEGMNYKDWMNNAFNPVMQYTGLKDKNGKEIYEGDILKKEWDKTVSEVRFKRGMFTCGQLTNDRFEIIGNIYENPELLEKQ